MSDQPAEVTATETEAAPQQSDQQPKPSETVDFWKQKAREQEKRAKDNADAAKRLDDLEQANKSEIDKAMDRVSKAEAEMATVPSKVADALRSHLIALHDIDADDAELFLTATDPELLLKQVQRLTGRESDRRKRNNVVPREGTTSTSVEGDEREFARNLFG